MGWEHFHLYKFEYNWNSFQYNGHSSPSVTLSELNIKENSTLYYLYDFGDLWEHAIELEKIIPQTKREKMISADTFQQKKVNGFIISL